MTENELNEAQNPVTPESAGEAAGSSGQEALTPPKKWYARFFEDTAVGRWFYKHRRGFLIFFLFKNSCLDLILTR